MNSLFKLFLFFVLIVSSVSYAQDTINFKIKPKTPPKTFNMAKAVPGYSSPNRERVDLFDKAGAPGKVAIPNNYVGVQMPPAGCENYFGICAYNRNSSFNVSERMRYFITNMEFDDVGFIQAELPSPMVQKEYYVSFKVSLADYSGFAAGGWGIYFSDKQIMDSSQYSARVIPQIKFPDMIKDKIGWTELRVKYKPNGTEKFMTIGCFGKDTTKKQEVKGGRDFALSKAYYYVADIKLIPIPEDRDKDGVWDSRDRCPDVFGLAEFAGCPDGDGDGIPDIDDACPKTKGLLAFRGCPDTDGDGVIDSEDKCPTVAGKLEDGGCPVDEVELAGRRMQSLINSIQFKKGKDKIKSSDELLDEAIAILKANPKLKITINEFMDEKGDTSDKAKELSYKRAQSVIEYLIDKGCTMGMINYTGPVPPEKKDRRL